MFTYGITNSGKTYTMIGNDQNPGMLPKTIEILMNLKQNFSKKIQKDTPYFDFDKFSKLKENEVDMNLIDFSIFLQSFEIYNDEIFDLSLEPTGNERTKLKLKETKNKKFEILGKIKIYIFHLINL